MGKPEKLIKESRGENIYKLTLSEELFFIIIKCYFLLLLHVIFSIIIWLSRAVSASVRKSGENLSDTLKLLGRGNKEEGWKVFDDVIIQNAQNGLVSFELNEHLER